MGMEIVDFSSFLESTFCAGYTGLKHVFSVLYPMQTIYMINLLIHAEKAPKRL